MTFSFKQFFNPYPTITLFAMLNLGRWAKCKNAHGWDYLGIEKEATRG
jgi:hypothetical protein